MSKLKDIDYSKFKKEFKSGAKSLKKEFIAGLKEGKELYLGLLTLNKKKIKKFFKK